MIYGAKIEPRMRRVTQEISLRRTPVVIILEMIEAEDSLAIWRWMAIFKPRSVIRVKRRRMAR